MILWDLPSGWAWKSVGSVADDTSRQNPKGMTDALFQYVDIGSVDNEKGLIKLEEVRTLEGKKAPSRARKVIHEGDVIIATTRPYLRNIALVPQILDDQICSTGFCVIRPIEGLADSRYLYFACRSQFFINQLIPKQRGANYPAVTDSDVYETQIPVPFTDNPERSLVEQRRIVARIEALLAEVREMRKLHGEITADTGELMASVRHELFSQLTDVAILKFDDIAESRLGKMLSKSAKTGQYSKPYMRNANVLWDEFKLDDVLEMDFPPEEQEKFRLKVGDLLICEGGEIGRTAVWNSQIGECYFQKALHRARLRDNKASPRYLMHFMAWAATNGEIAKLHTGSAIPHLTGVKLKTLDVLWPEPEKQFYITAYLDSVNSEISEMTCTNQETKLQVEELEQSILAQAFRGEL